jgi:xanthine dehydrogenase YagS FAD-binding subunit
VGPEQQVQRENVLAADEILTEVAVPASPAGWQGTYLKARERTAGDFPLVSVALGYCLIDGHMRQARVVLGGVATTPRRCRDAEAMLEGGVPSQELASQVTQMVLASARPLAHNAFKLDIARALVPRAILAVAAQHRAA